MKIRLVGAELFHADGRTNGDRQTDITRLTVAFRNFAASPKNLQELFAADKLHGRNIH